MAGSINSINTNEGAYRALSSTRSQSAALQQAQKRLQTGLRVADAADDASTFAVAQGLRGDLQAFTAVQSSLANGAGLGSVTQAALGQVSDLSNQLQQRLTQLSDGSLSAQQRATYSADVQSLTSQIQSTIQQAGFNGQNLLQAGASGTSFLADTNGASIAVSGQGQVGTGAATLQGAIDTSTAATSQASLGALQNFQSTVAQAAANNAADTRGLVQQSNLTNSISDAVTIGLGAQVDADLGASAAQASARQVGRQLAFTSLGLANSQPSALLGLTR
jgi:flagellin